MPTPLAILNIVALTEDLITEATPNLQAFAQAGTRHHLTTPLPAVTTTVQTSILTGTNPATHGIVANGWYNRADAEIRFWQQSNHLVQAPRLWQTARELDPSITTAQLFWWYNMHADVEFSVTPRPIYKADGRKIPDIYTQPANLRGTLQHKLGRFPLFNFWGPAANITSSQWIADAAKLIAEAHNPTLNLIYLPHLDYALQKHGPNSPEARAAATEIDAIAGDLIRFYQSRGTRLIILSEYGITPVNGAVPINRILRNEGLLAIRGELGTEQLDPGGSRAFAVADHQVAHVYIRDPADLERTREICEATPGVDQVLDAADLRDIDHLHDRSGDLLLIADQDKWFTYDFWLDDRRAPDYARTVDIHRKPGYDPRELFIDPAIRAPKLAIASRLARKALGFRTLMNVIPLDAALVKGSHGRNELPPKQGPLLISDSPGGDGAPLITAEAHDLILAALLTP